MITRNSRYRREDAYPSNDPGRADHPIPGVAPHLPDPLDVRRVHRVIAGERLDLLANRYYGDPLMYWLLCDATDEIFPDDLVVPGKVLRVPRNRI